MEKLKSELQNLFWRGINNKMKIGHWNIDPKLKDELDNHYQAKQSFEMKNESPEEIIKAYTFSYGAPNLNLETVTELFDYVERIIGKPIRGVGLEVGAGPGTHAAILAKRKKVQKVYAVEASEPIVSNLMPAVVPYVCGSDSHKVVGVVGDFNHLDLPDESVDFVFDFFSLHHSPNLDETLQEINRVLKRDGFLFCFDKARDDAMSNEELELLLDIEYPSEFKRKMGVSEDEKHTRRMNGENEYRRKDWFKYFNKAGFKKSQHYNIARTTSGKSWIAFCKRLFSKIPYWVQIIATNLLRPKPTNHISSHNRVYSNLVNDYQKEISLLIAYK
jgi:SAM-dependent methyltransferase